MINFDLEDVQQIASLQRYVKFVRPDIPQLVFADSAMWMFCVHRCAYDPFPHQIWECSSFWPGLRNLMVTPKDAYFKTDQDADFNS